VLETRRLATREIKMNLEVGRSDFDFMIGSWNVKHRRLNSRLSGCRDWTEFSGTSTTRKVLGGFGNIEDNFLDFPEGAYTALAMRSFDPTRSLWAIWWLDGRAPHSLDKPVVGSFDGDLGEFYAEDTLGAKRIHIRFLWRRLGTDSARWEQAFCLEGATEWETNWIMEFSRISN